MAKKRATSTPYKTTDYLKTDRDIQAYLGAALENGDPRGLLIALRNVAQLRGMARVAKAGGITRPALYRMLSADGNPELKSLTRILHALGFQLAVAKRAARSSAFLKSKVADW